MKWSNIIVSALVSIHSMPVVAAAAERCEWNAISNDCASKEILAESLKSQKCGEAKNQTACAAHAAQSGCVWGSASGYSRIKSQCNSQWFSNYTSATSQTRVCKTHDKTACGKNKGCEWYALNGPETCMSQGSIAIMNSPITQNTFFCSLTSKSVCTADGRSCETEKVTVTKEVCEGRLISPWMANACYAHDATMLTCMRGAPSTSACGKADAEALCAQAHACYEIKRDVSEGMNSTSMKEMCEMRATKSGCAPTCSKNGGSVATKANGTKAKTTKANGTSSKAIGLQTSLAGLVMVVVASQ